MNRNVSPSCVQVKGLKLQPCRQQASSVSEPFLSHFHLLLFCVLLISPYGDGTHRQKLPLQALPCLCDIFCLHYYFHWNISSTRTGFYHVPCLFHGFLELVGRVAAHVYLLSECCSTSTHDY